MLFWRQKDLRWRRTCNQALEFLESIELENNSQPICSENYLCVEAVLFDRR